MWINKEVNIPEALISAQRDGQLAVFAGAGVSMGAPSNLPNFDDLAEQIADGTSKRKRYEPVDAFLGRLEPGLDVQGRARRILGTSQSAPTDLHREIVQLFATDAHLRIVTTNFDRHFTTTGREAFPGADVFNAPALPLGRHFSGIINLHGTVDRPEPLILTDSEFGRAYLTDAWATRFLAEMFRTYVVLFVGYSHRDVVMRYLARAFGGSVSGARGRFALIASGEDGDWSSLGIEAIPYPKRRGPNRHRALSEALKAWVSHARMGALDHERRIADIVQYPPPLEPDLVDYMRAVLADPVTMRFFVRHASGPEWLRWAEERGAFASLVAPSARRRS
jgi:SIR2-like domain